jgi:hypothetical protein
MVHLLNANAVHPMLQINTVSTLSHFGYSTSESSRLIDFPREVIKKASLKGKALT